MVDYIIAIACNSYEQIESMLQAVPYNNSDALELGKHLLEQYQVDMWKKYLGDAKVHKLTYKIKEEDVREDSIMMYLMEQIKSNI